jgi:predicted transcriptional regulator
MEEYKVGPGVIDETVKVAKKFLEEHPEEIKKLSACRRLNTIGADIICSFLNWNESRVRYSLERLRATGQIPPLNKDDKITPVDKESLYKMPTDFMARKFTDVVKKRNIPIESQKKMADSIWSDITDTGEKKDGGTYVSKGKGISERILEEEAIKHSWTPPQRETLKERKIKDYEEEIACIRDDANEFSKRLGDLKKLQDELGPYTDYLQGQMLNMALDRLVKQIELLIKKQKNNETDSEFRNENFRLPEKNS